MTFFHSQSLWLVIQPLVSSKTLLAGLSGCKLGGKMLTVKWSLETVCMSDKAIAAFLKTFIAYKLSSSASTYFELFMEKFSNKKDRR